MITQAELKEILDYNQETGEFKWRKELGKRAMKGSTAGWVMPQGYLRVGIMGTQYLMHRLAWVYVHGELQETSQIDHINHNKSDNRISNLRCVTHSGNQKNAGIRKDNKSGVVGVHWTSGIKKWTAAICSDGKIKHLGNFTNKDDAIKARKDAEKSSDFTVITG